MIAMGKPTITVVKPPKNQERCQQCPPGVACLWVCAPGISTEEIAHKFSEVFTGVVFRASETCPAYDVPVGEPENPTLEIWDYVG